MNVNEIVNIVEKLNYEFDDKCKSLVENYGLIIEFSSIGYIDYIKFLDIIIWNSDDDERNFIDDENDYEPLEQFIRKKLNEILRQLSNVRF